MPRGGRSFPRHPCRFNNRSRPGGPAEHWGGPGMWKTAARTRAIDRVAWGRLNLVADRSIPACASLSPAAVATVSKPVHRPKKKNKEKARARSAAFEGRGEGRALWPMRIWPPADAPGRAPFAPYGALGLRPARRVGGRWCASAPPATDGSIDVGYIRGSMEPRSSHAYTGRGMYIHGRSRKKPEATTDSSSTSYYGLHQRPAKERNGAHARRKR